MSDPYNTSRFVSTPSRKPREVVANTEQQRAEAEKLLASAPTLMLAEEIDNTGTRHALAALSGQRFTYNGEGK